MKIAFAGNKARGAACLRAVVSAGHEVVLVVVHRGTPASAAELLAEAQALGIPVIAPADVNSPDAVDALAAAKADVLVLAGYGQIVRRAVLETAPHGAVNLHAGKLPAYRGSSPLNWALINGETEVGISVIQVDDGVDTGDVLAEHVIGVGPDDTIADVEERVNELFPSLLVDVLARVGSDLEPRPQGEAGAAYYPLRFPDDGLILWDMVDATSAHNRIRALTDPFPGAFTVHAGRRVTLLRSRLESRLHLGEPGRVYRVTSEGVLVAAADRCLWITKARYADDGADALSAVARYDTFGTVRASALALLEARQ